MGISTATATALRRELLPSPTPEPAGYAANAPKRHEHEHAEVGPPATERQQPSPLEGEGGRRSRPGEGGLSSPAAPTNKASKVAEARMKGYEGEACSECGNFTMVRNGTCLKCDTCGGTSGCS
jgi:ribonucleoside-diphosphate reductase alpha chain